MVHIDRGILTGFMNSRQTAAIFGGAPNGHFTSTHAALVPLVRMSSTVFAGGDRNAADILREVDRGWYLAGHRIPSIRSQRSAATGIGDPQPGELQRRVGGDGLPHGGAYPVEVRLCQPDPPGGLGEPVQVPGQRERSAADHLGRFEHAVAHGVAMVEYREPGVVLVDQAVVHPDLHHSLSLSVASLQRWTPRPAAGRP